MLRLFTDMLGRYDSLFIAPHAQDVLLGCPARLYSEAERGRRVLVLALFDPVGDAKAADLLSLLRADYAPGGLPPARQRRKVDVRRPALLTPEDEAMSLDGARLLAETGPRTQAVHVYAPLGLGGTVDHLVTYEAAVRAFATEPGRNLFLYEERPEAFVPGAVRARLAALGARLPPAARHLAERGGLLRHLWTANEPRLLRGETLGVGDRLAGLATARRRFRDARPWNPLRARGPRLQPIVHTADEEASGRAREVAAAVLAANGKDRTWAAPRFNARAAAAGRRLGGAHHAERLWLFLPSNDGLPEAQHPWELGERLPGAPIDAAQPGKVPAAEVTGGRR